MTYYSALHYAAKAEKSANLAEQYATQATQFSGKVIQIGFDGFMENGQLVFKHSPAGVDIPYDLLDDYEYEIDMAYSGTDLADNVELVVKNGADTINFVSALHRDSTTPVTVKDMKSVMRYNESTGYRWLFKAAFKVTPSGNKVLLLYPVISVGDSETGRNIGDIFYTSRLDNELNGAVDADGAVYSVEAFTGEKSVPKLLRKGSLPSVSMAEYESIVSANGSCRAWGWDNGDTFRVPTAEKMKRVLVAKKEATASDSTWWNLYSDGWLEQGYSFEGSTASLTFLKPFKDTNYSIAGSPVAYTSHGVQTVSVTGKTTTGITWAGSNYSSSSWVFCGYAEIPTEAEYQFQNIETHRAMVQLSTGIQEDATQLKEYKFNNPCFFGQSIYSDVDPKNGSWLLSNGAFHSGATYVDYYQWLTDIKSGNKTVDGVSVKSVDDEYTDYDFVINITDETFRLPLLDGSEDLIGNNGETLNLPSSGNEIIATKNGKINLIGRDSTDSRRLILNNITNGVYENFSAPEENGAYGGISVEVKKGDVVRVEYRGYSSYEFYLSSAVGNGSLYFYVGDTLQDPAVINAGAVLSEVDEVKRRQSVIDIPSTSGTVPLADNTIYSGTMTDTMTFVLPTVTDATKYHQIKAMLYLPVVTIDWGTDHYIGGDAPDVSEAGQYMIYWDYVPALDSWAVGAMKVV